jgi:hypothetical protein
MIAKFDLAKMYETVLSIPGMNEKVRIDFKIPLKNVLILSKAIERGLLGKETDDLSPDLMDLVSRETTEEIMGISTEILQKAGLLELNEKLKRMAEK